MKLLKHARKQLSARQREDLALLARSPVFDHLYYAEQAQEHFSSRETAAEHFLRADVEQRANPHPLFDVSYYTAASPEVLAGNLNPLVHFLRSGGANGQAPHPLFSSSYYLKTYPDVGAQRINPLEHYLAYGAKEGRDPHPLFDTDYYLATDENVVRSGHNPLVHFVEYASQFPDHKPNPLFDPRHYLTTYPDVASSGLHPFVHYLDRGVRERRSPSADVPWLGSEGGELRSRRLRRGSAPRYTALLTSHDASRTGAPLIALELARRLARDHRVDLLIALVRGGPLMPEFAEAGRLVTIESLTRCVDVRPSTIRMLLYANFSPAPVYALCNSAESHPLLDAAHQLDVPSVTLVHEFAQVYEPSHFARVIASSSKVIFPAQVVQEAAEEHLGRRLPQAKVAPQGLFSHEFPRGARSSARRQLLAELGLQEPTYVVLSCGYTDQRKGPDLFVATARRFRDLRPDTAFAFVWIGDGGYGNTSAQFWASADVSQAGLEDHVFFLGAKEQVDRFFLAADVFLLPSRLDPFPCVVLEAMAAGMPVLCFDRGTGASEAIARADSMATPYLDVSTLAIRLEELYLKPDLRAEIGRENRDRALTRYDFGRYASSIRKECEDLAGVPCDGKTADHPAGTKELAGTRRVVVPCADWGLSGVYSTLECVGRELRRRGWEVEILFTHPERFVAARWNEAPELPYSYLETADDSHQRRWEALIGSLERAAPCVVLWTFDPHASAVSAALTEQVMQVGWIQSDDNEYYEPAHRLGRYWNGIAAVSEHIKERVTALNPAFAERTSVVPNSTVGQEDLEAPRPPRPRDTIRLVYCGRIVHHQKRVLDLVPLLSELEGRNVRYELTVIGEDPETTVTGRIEGSTRERLQDELSAVASEGTVVFKGWQSRDAVLQTLLASDLLLLLSDFEGFPLSVVESMACGCPAMCYSIPSGVPELIQDGENGLIVDSRNYGVWADRISELVAEPGRLAEMSAAARKTIAGRFTVERAADRFEALFRKVTRDCAAGEFKRPDAVVWHSSTGDVLLPPELQLHPDSYPTA